jgi:RNA polymerase sigma-70 factor (ECF subfamily)
MPLVNGKQLEDHRRAVSGFVRRLVGDVILADDLTQETFLRAQRTEAGPRGDASEQTWLCAIALNLVRDHFRAKARAKDETTEREVIENLPSSAENAEQTALNNEMSACVGKFLAELPSPRYEVVALHDQSALSHAEIAQHLGISESNSRVLLHRGRMDLKKILERNCLLSFDQEGVPCELKPAN